MCYTILFHISNTFILKHKTEVNLRKREMILHANYGKYFDPVLYINVFLLYEIRNNLSIHPKYNF